MRSSPLGNSLSPFAGKFTAKETRSPGPPQFRPRSSGPQLRPTGPNLFMFQDHTVVDKTNVLGGVVGLGPLLAQQVQDPGGQHSELAVLNELAQVRQSCLLALGVLLNDADDAVHDGTLVLEATLQRQMSS